MWRQWSVIALVLIGCLPWTGCGRSLQGSVGDLPRRDNAASREHGLGFNAAFEAELKKVGPISAREFARRYSPPDYLARPSWDPTTAKFWDRLMSDPKAKTQTDNAKT